MTQQFKLNVAPRAQTGRSASRRLRKVNRVPAILYGKHTKPVSLSIEGPEFTRLLKTVAGRAVLIELARSDSQDKALSFLQEVQRDPITDKYLHVDLQEVKADERFEIRVPVHVTGESFGVKNQSGVLEMNIHLLRVRVLPKDLPEAITVDVTELKVGEAIKVSSLKPVPGVEFLDAKGQPIVSCVEPVAEIVQEVVAAAPVEGEVAAVPGAVPAEGAAAATPAGDAKAAAAAPAAAPGAKPGAAPAGAKPGAAPAGAKPAAAPAGAKPAGAAAAKTAAPAKK
ncbi:MAG: 50S ribosomal protein L25 [Verrucomicrobia bacterium]|nr:50S ribosomal protein L25 [Verrucomicrobiota bacterium]